MAGSADYLSSGDLVDLVWESRFVLERHATILSGPDQSDRFLIATVNGQSRWAPSRALRKCSPLIRLAKVAE